MRIRAVLTGSPPFSWATRHAPALAAGDFRLLWAANFGAFLSQWVVTTTVIWLMLDMTDSALFLGLIGLARGLPAFPMSMYGGILADRLPKRTLLIGTQTAAWAITASFFLLSMAGLLSPWLILGATFMLSISNALDSAGRISIISELVERPLVPSAVSLNALAQTLGRMLGPAVAGACIAWLGPAATLGVAAIVPLFTLLAVVSLRGGRSVYQAARQPWFRDLHQALRYAGNDTGVRAVLSLVAGATFFGMAYTVLMPVFARDVFGVGPSGYGLLTSAGAMGAVAASLMLAPLGARWGLGNLVPVGAASLGALMLLFALNQSFAVAVALSLAMGAASSLYLTAGNTTLQMRVPAEFRGRVLGFHQLSPVALHHIGTMVLGTAAAAIGPGAALAIGGCITIALSAAVVRLLPNPAGSAPS